MNSDTITLLLNVGIPLSDDKGAAPKFDMDNSSVSRLKDFLSGTNGLIAFESALIVRPFLATVIAEGIESWNRIDNWKGHYDNPEVHQSLFFAEDTFGFQFGIKPDGTIGLLDVETGQLDPFCNGFDEWIKMILDDYNVHTGYPVMHEWQLANGPILPRRRLRPSIPFVLGGDYETKSMRAIPIDEIMRFGADLSRQIKDIPDDGKVRLVVRNEKDQN